MKHKFLLAAVAVAALSLAACSSGGGSGTGSTTKSAASNSGDKSPITIGMVIPLTGPYAPLGTGDKAAAEQVVQSINDGGGIDGRKINLVIKDDKTDVNQSVSLFNQLAADKNVSVVLSSSNVSASVAVGQSAEAAKLPILALGPVSAFADGSNKYAFTVPATPELYAQEMVNYLQSTGVKKLAIMYDGKDIYGTTGNSATKSAAQKAGIDVVLDEKFDSSATDFSAQIQHVKDSGTNNLLVWGSGPAPVIITKQVAAAGGINLFMTGSEATTLYTQPSGAAAEGVTIACAAGVAASAMPDGPFKTMIDDFAQTYKTNNKVYPPQFAFDGGSGIQLAAAAIKKAGSSDRGAIRDALENLDVLTLNGHYTYSPTNHTGLTTDDLAVVTVKKGEFVPTSFVKDQFSKSLPK